MHFHWKTGLGLCGLTITLLFPLGVDTSRAESLATAQQNWLWEHLERTQVLPNKEQVGLDAVGWEAFQYPRTNQQELADETDVCVEKQEMYPQC